MPAVKQLTGMGGVYLVAAELSRRGFLASPTSRSAIGADLLVTDQACLRAYSVQVKTNAVTHSFWLLGKKARSLISKHYIYVLVNLRRAKWRGNRDVCRAELDRRKRNDFRDQCDWKAI